MKVTRTQLLMSVITAAGLLFGGSRAVRAEGVDVNVTPQNFRASGTYHVVVNRTAGNTFSVFVQGNNDGRHTPGADPLTEPAKHAVEQVSIGFLRSNGTFIPPVPGSAAGGTSGPWVPSIASDTQLWNAPVVALGIDPFGGNQFNGQTTLTTGEQVGAFAITLQDGNQQWFIQAPVGSNVPEPASLALVLPGMLPLGLVLLRRHASRRDPRDKEGAAT